MSQVMRELAEFCGFYFEATTFPQLFFYMFTAICGTAILAGIIKLLFYIAVRSKELYR